MPATPVNITAISRTGNVVTVVTAIAHGLVVGQAGWLQGEVNDASFNGIYTVASVPNATTFTYNQTGANATPTAAGTIQPARQWVALDLYNGNGGELDQNFEMWFPVPSGSELAGASGSSLGSNHITADESNAIAAGRLFVIRKQVPFPVSYSGAQIQAFIDALYASIFNYRNGTLVTGSYYGYYSDGTANLGRL